VLVIVLVSVTILAIAVYDYAVIITSSIIGAFCFFRGISILTGGFPTEKMVDLSIDTNQVKGLPWSFWFYISLMFVTAVVAMSLQFAHRKTHKEEYAIKHKLNVARYLDYKTMRQMAVRKKNDQFEAQMAEMTSDGEKEANIMKDEAELRLVGKVNEYV
jgi:hypothetical protein